MCFFNIKYPHPNLPKAFSLALILTLAATSLFFFFCTKSGSALAIELFLVISKPISLQLNAFHGIFKNEI